MLHRKSTIPTIASAALRAGRKGIVALMAAFAAIIVSCEREPMLHLHEEGGNTQYELPVVDLDLRVFWNYELDYGVEYDWQAEWYYDKAHTRIPVIGYTEPREFWMRRYYTENTSAGKHTYIPTREPVDGNTYQGRFNWGYWDLLAQNVIQPNEQGLVAVDYTETPDSVVYAASTTMHPVRRDGSSPRFTRAFHQPEEIFAGYKEGEYVDPNLTDFIWVEERQAWVKTADITLYPCTYIYLTQVILHNNRGRIEGVDGNATISGMARTTNITTGKGGNDAISVHYNIGLETGVDYTDAKDGIAKRADIIGGRVMTFGLCNINPSRVVAPKRGRNALPNGTVIAYAPSGHPLYVKNNEVHVDDGKRHHIDITATFNNGMDSIIVFDVTDQVRRRYKGGVITVELDMDTVPLPYRSGGSGFDAVVVPPDSVTYEFDM